jgi:potassium-transporting ATPase KdpC subunit
MSHVRPALVLLLLFTLLTGIAYPLAVTGVAQAVMPGPAGGSLVAADGRILGSALIGQDFTSDRYLWPRPSATAAPDPQDPAKTVDAPYNASSSAGSNLGPTSKVLAGRLAAGAERLRAAGITGPYPGDALTTSASGLDPHVTPAFALAQVPRLARARGLAEEQVRGVVLAAVEDREWGLFGEPRVNVLAVNRSLDATPAKP